VHDIFHVPPNDLKKKKKKKKKKNERADAIYMDYIRGLYVSCKVPWPLSTAQILAQRVSLVLILILVPRTPA